MVKISDSASTLKCVEAVEFRDLINMTCKTIDVDKYEILNDSTSLREYDGGPSASSGLMADFLPIDAEIIDYGISEDELEDERPPSLPLESSSSLTKVSSADTEKQTSVYYTNATKTSSSKTKSLSIKVVDCDKYPWYYAKHKRQILKRKYFAAVNQARNIVKCLKSKESKPTVFIDLDDLSDNSDNCKSDVKNDQFVKINAPKSPIIINKTVYNEREYTEHKQIQRKICDSEMIQVQQAVSDRLTSSSEIDLKRNKGLIGMKVRRICENDKRKENCKAKYTKKSRKHKEKTRKQKEKHFNESYETAVDKTFESLCHSTESAYVNKTQMYKKSAQKKKHNKNDDANKQKSKNGKLKENVSLSCSIKISSPQILMKIKKITPGETKKNNIAARQIANNNEDSGKVRADHQQVSSDCNIVIKQKPMPKSKRIALEKITDDIEQEKLKNIEDLSKNETEQLKIVSTIVTTSTSTIKQSTNYENISAAYVTQKNTEKINRPFLYNNKLTELSIIEIAPEITNKSSKPETHKKEFKKKLVKKKEIFDQSKAFKTVEPLQALMTNDVHNVSSGNKHEGASTIYNASSSKEGLTSVTEQIALDVGKNHKTDFCSDSEIQGELPLSLPLPSMNKNINNNNIFNLKNESNLMKSINKLKEVNIQQKTTPKSLTARKIVLNSMSISSRRKSYEKMTTIRQAYLRKHSNNLPVNNINNIDDHIKSNNPMFESNIQSFNSPQKTSEPHGYIIPNMNPPQQLSLYHRLSQSKDGDITNQLNENKQTQPNILPAQDMKSIQCNNISMYNPDHYILSDNTVGIECTPNSVVNKSDKPQNLRIPAILRPPKTPVISGATSRPKIVKGPNSNINPQYGARFRRTPSVATGPLFNTPETSPFGQRPFAVRSQTPLRPVRPWRFDYHQRLNDTYPPTSYNIQRMSLLKPTTSYNHQNKYTQRPVYNQRSYEETLLHGNMPPGLSDVHPNNVLWPYCAHYPTFPQPPPPTTHQNLTNSETRSIIGQNRTGLVKKINIPSSANSNLNNEVDSKQGILKEVNTKTDANIFTHVNTVNNANKTFTDSTVDETTPVSTKSEMMKELEKAMTSVVSPVKLDTKRLYPNVSDCIWKAPKEQVNDEQARRPGPLPKKIKFDHELTTAPQKAKQIPKTGYSPPILPITAFQNILSEVPTTASSVMTCETLTANQSFKVTQSSLNNKLNNNFQSKWKKDNQNVQAEEDNTKKISLEEYKKRSLKLTTAEECGGNKRNKTKGLKRNFTN